MRIAIFGSGGVGGYLGGRLAEAGEEVIFIARGQHLQAIKERGLRVDSIEGDFVIHPAQASDNPEEVGPVDAVLVAVKTWQVTGAAEAIRPMVGPDTFVVPLQNGVEAPGQLAEVLGADHVLGGLCGMVSFIAGPGHIKHTGILPFIKFGEMDNHRSERVEQLYRAFKRAKGMDVEVPPDIRVAMWQKFLLIAAWSGVGGVTRAPIGVIRSLPETRRMLEQTMQEVYKVGRAHNVDLPGDVVKQTMVNFFDKVPASGTASMQRDIMEGRPSELEAQNGAVLRLGHAVGIPTPMNAFIYHTLLPAELRVRGQVEFPG